LSDKIRQEFSKALLRIGISEAEAAEFADLVLTEISAIEALPFDLNDPLSARAVADLVMVGLRLSETATASFHVAAQITLPSRAPELWAERVRKKHEKPIDFLRRV
jgi:antitoxin component of RelBE/YafQ-DinJ toxin-antitoxin module